MWFLVPPPDRRVVFLWMIAPTLLFGPFTDLGSLGRMTRAQVDRDTPGILEFELAGGEEASAAIVRAYRDRGLTSLAIIALWADVPFLLGYSLTIGLACVITAAALQAVGRGVPWLGAAFAGGVTAAALLDFVEDLALLRILYVGVAWPYPLLASLCAGAKFALILAGLLYVAVGGFRARRYALAIGGLAVAVLLAFALVPALWS